ncbi:coiled-coil domain-containing protein 122-like [Nematolebias whitei]|uniref:coiled-coil domain-containing protein 122-like n=1 Tax=Nematolebias whitei TaxID=451745 RepID=UPI00189A9844|nr:coiled-coil domain-containing protein 122-like [Nematolebias whitei]
MSKTTESPKAFQETQDFLLTKVVEDVSQHGFAQNEDLKEKRKMLSSLQATLSDVEKKGEAAEQELRSKERDVLMVEGEMEHLERQIKDLHDRCATVRKENTELHIVISEEKEKARLVLATFDTYRAKMKGHRAAVLHSVSQTEVYKELEEKKVLVQKLKQMKEQLKEDLQNPNGNTVQIAKSEVNALKKEISERRKTLAERREELREEFETHVQLKKDIKIQNRRHEAIVKRLHCQVSRAQAAHRQMLDEVFHLKRQLEQLDRQQWLSQDSVVSDY